MNPFTALVVAKPPEAAREIKAAYVRAKCCQNTTAAELGASLNTFRRWVEQLGLGEALAALEAKALEEGWHHGRVGGRPRKDARSGEVEHGSRKKPGQPVRRRHAG